MSIFGLILCEGCGSIMDEENTELYKEVHGPGHLETLSRTTCCRSGYTDVDGQAIIDELGRIQETRYGGHAAKVHVLSQIKRNNIDAIIPVLEQAFDL